MAFLPSGVRAIFKYTSRTAATTPFENSEFVFRATLKGVRAVGLLTREPCSTAMRSRSKRIDLMFSTKYLPMCQINCVNRKRNRECAQNEAYKIPIAHTPSHSLERSGAKYNETPTKTRSNTMAAYIYQQPNEDGIIFVNVKFTDPSTGVVIAFESLPLLDSDSKSDLTKSGIEEAKRLAKLLIQGHFD